MRQHFTFIPGQYLGEPPKGSDVGQIGCSRDRGENLGNDNLGFHGKGKIYDDLLVVCDHTRLANDIFSMFDSS